MQPSENVTCPYFDEASYSAQLCSLWCEIQGLKSNKNCQIPCPYLGDPEETLFCELWEELQSLSNAAIEEAVSASPSTSYAVGPTPAPSYAVACKYEDHATNSTGLCDLWCDVIAYEGGLCLESDDCPYALQVSESLLCALWNEIQLGNTTSAGSTLSPDYQNLTGTATAAPNGEISYNECPYLTDPNSFTACSLWCTLREVAESETCTGAPVCPYENATTPYDETLCDLWNEAESLKNAGTSSTLEPSENVTCPYFNSQRSTDYSEELCSLWCEIQNMKLNRQCVTPTNANTGSRYV